jgi:hypothetical protein
LKKIKGMKGMKIKMLEDYAVAFDGIHVQHFCKDEELNLSEAYAETLIERGKAAYVAQTLVHGASLDQFQNACKRIHEAAEVANKERSVALRDFFQRSPGSCKPQKKRRFGIIRNIWPRKNSDV